QQGFDPWDFVGSADAAWNRARRLFDFNQFTRDLRGWLAYERGCEHIDPHADRRVLEFALAVPEPMYRQNGVHRSFARAVFADRLPAEILNERRRGVQDANWFRRLNVRRPTLAADIERLEASPTARRLIDLPRVKRLLAQWPADEHAAQKLDLRLVHAVIRAAHIGNFVRWVEGSNM
ncbi:MAG: asparagine synthase-related protein, partial [Alphaproteobacteria bacterium]